MLRDDATYTEIDKKPRLFITSEKYILEEIINEEI